MQEQTEYQIRLKVADSQEPWFIRDKLLQVGWQQKSLFTADYWFFTNDYKKVGIERKTIDDLVTSLGERLGRQLENMLDHYQISILLIEGSWRNISGKLITGQGSNQWGWATIWNYLRTWQDRGITLELTSDIEHTIVRLNELYAYYQKEYHSSTYNKGTIGDDRVLAFPSGCRGKTGLALLKKFGSLKAIANASPDMLMLVDKVGEKKAQNIIDHFNNVRGNDGEVQTETGSN